MSYWLKCVEKQKIEFVIEQLKQYIKKNTNLKLLKNKNYQNYGRK